MKIKNRRGLNSNALLTVVGISTLLSITETKAVMRPVSRVASTMKTLLSRGVVQQSTTPAPGPGMVSSKLVPGKNGQLLTTRMYDLKYGDFKVTSEKVVLPSGKTTEIKNVSFVNTRGEKIKFIEPKSAMEKLLMSNDKLIKQKYIGEDGIEKTFMGVKGSGGSDGTGFKKSLTTTTETPTKILPKTESKPETLTTTGATSKTSEPKTLTTTGATSKTEETKKTKKTISRRASDLPKPDLSTIVEED